MFICVREPCSGVLASCYKQEAGHLGRKASGKAKQTTPQIRNILWDAAAQPNHNITSCLWRILEPLALSVDLTAPNFVMGYTTSSSSST